ncbi:hypothetical protein RIF29_35464 [Crotalaria pallida]|uniref:Epidermal patterning factor-like protein n=1 Tax=Crotalaria pallida TaxID=3830 RepID=A0AAN9EFN6_CROPI
MGLDHHHVICGQRLGFISISLLFLIISSWIQQGLVTEGNKYTKQFLSCLLNNVGEDKTILRAQIGSRPPRCERRCRACGHCEAIQVPTNPQMQNGKKINSSNVFSTIAYARGNDNSNYKPMSWKCKCGNLIFNP